MIIKQIEKINIMNFRDFDQNPGFIEPSWKVKNISKRKSNHKILQKVVLVGLSPI
jgi:hypothetical protein